MPKIDIGNLTQDETRELATECLSLLTLDQKVQAVLGAFDDEERDELVAWLETPSPETDNA